MSSEIFLPFVAELIKWNKSINLVHESTIENAHTRHILDSLQVKPFIDYEKDVIVDIGSGAGFPGMILAIDGAKNVHLVEPTGKKNIFLNHIKNMYKLPVTIHECGWQNLELNNATVVTSRAFSALTTLLEVMSFVSRETKNVRGVFLKGDKIQDEILEAQQVWNFEFEIFKCSSLENGCVIKVWSLCKR